jgi:S-(hydroxymethyl)glutathione dehydrogenase/alcohol dehydrogenase
METRAAIIHAEHRPWEIGTITLDPPKAGEVLVHLAASGLCHSDDHFRTGDLGGFYPIVGGHEGAGVVEEVGAGVTDLRPGDHVVLAAIPACGHCPSCATGHSNVCDLGDRTMLGVQVDGTSRHHLADGTDLASMMCLGTFSPYTVVHESSCVKILDHYPLATACLVGCGVTTGWGSAVYAAGVQPGDDVVVIGAGGLGSAAIQGARHAGAERIVAVDPVPFKREMAQGFGATHTAASVAEALPLVEEVTWGKLAEKVVCTMGVGDGALLESILALTAKRGRVVVTNMHPLAETTVSMSLTWLTLFEKQIVGCVYGSGNARYEIPHLLRLADLGLLDLDGMITRTYPLEGVNDGYADMLAGRNIRGVLHFD